jgi:dephospho-CoA kinase
VKFVASSGGVGLGKSTVAALLVVRGAVVVDVDVVSRELQQPGRPVFKAMVLRWGDKILLPQDNSIGRQ